MHRITPSVLYYNHAKPGQYDRNQAEGNEGTEVCCKHTLVAVKGLEQVVNKSTVQDMALHTVTSRLKISVDVQLFKITHMATGAHVF